MINEANCPLCGRYMVRKTFTSEDALELMYIWSCKGNNNDQHCVGCYEDKNGQVDFSKLIKQPPLTNQVHVDEEVLLSPLYEA
jgi:hypothetical protein